MTNPFDFGRTMLEAWEKNMGEMFERLTRDEQFIKHMGSALSGSLDLKKQMEGHLEKYLKSINMPTKADLERMLMYLQRIEQKLLDLEDLVTAGNTPLPQREPPARPSPKAAPASGGRAKKRPAGSRKASR